MRAAALLFAALPLFGEPQPPDSANLLASRISAALARVRWDTTYPGDHAACRDVTPHPDLRFGLYDYAEFCSAETAGVIAESFYYPVDGDPPAMRLRRAGFRIATLDPQINGAVEQLLAAGLTQRYGPAAAPAARLFEIGVSMPSPGLSWQAGSVTIFLHHNRTYVEPAGIRDGVQLIAVRREVLAAREEVQHVTAALSVQAVPGRDPEPQTAGQARVALLRALRESGEGDRDHRAEMLVAADHLAVRLGRLLIQRSVQNGSEILTESPEAPTARRVLARYGIVYTGPGHYSGDLEYDRGLLLRAWREFPETAWGQRAFLTMQRLSCSLGARFGCKGPGCFREVIRQGEEFLRRYPDTQFRKEQLFHLAMAYETWWSLSKATPGDPTAEGAHVDQAGAEMARQKALALYEELDRIFPGSPEAAYGRPRLARLKLRLATGERTFFCFTC